MTNLVHPIQSLIGRVNMWLWLSVLARFADALELIDEQNVLQVFQHAQGMRCKTRMFSAPTNPSEEMPIMDRLQQSAHWCARHPGCYGVQLYDGGDVDA